MSPTIFRVGSLRFFFFSREEKRLHVHVEGPGGEAKFWLEPSITLAKNRGLGRRDRRRAQELIESHEELIRQWWKRYFDA